MPQFKDSTLIPYYVVQDAQRAMDFYRDAFGFELFSNPALNKDGQVVHVEMCYQNTLFMFCSEGAFNTQDRSPLSSGHPIPLTLYVYCLDVDALYARAIDHGAKSVEPPQDGFWGDRFCRLQDPDQYEWAFATPLLDENGERLGAL